LIVNKQVEESKKGVKIIKSHSQFARPASSTAHAYGAESASAAAPPNFHLCPAEKVSVIPHMHFDGSPLSFCY
jgi:hypothetical protein